MEERTCPQGDHSFVPRRADQQYCSRVCKQRAHSKRQRDRAEEVTCSVEGCSRKATHPAMKEPLCSMHYRRKRLTGEVGSPDTVYGKRFGKWPCSVQGCPRTYYANDLCSMHYNRQRQTGDPGRAGPLKAAAGEGCYITQDGYRFVVYQAGGRTKKIAEHRLVMEQQLGRPLWPWENVHHRNGRRADNRPANLELWITPQPAGQRPEDLAAWVVEFYPDLIRNALAQRG
jgi:hypothetical protein